MAKNAKLEGLLKSLDSVLNPPATKRMTDEEFVAYAKGQQTALAAETGAPQLARLASLKEAIKAADLAFNAEKPADAVEFVPFAPNPAAPPAAAPATKAAKECPGCGKDMEHKGAGVHECKECGGKFSPAKKNEAPAAPSAAPAATAAPAPAPVTPPAPAPAETVKADPWAGVTDLSAEVAAARAARAPAAKDDGNRWG